MVESPSGECHDCGQEYERLNQHWAMSDCGPDSGAKETYTCDLDECDETFEDYPTRIEARGRKSFYCCQEHKDKGHQSGKWVNCSWCGDRVYKQECMLDSMGDYTIDNHFCNKECESEFKQHNWVREGHPNWKGGAEGVNTVRNSLSEKAWFRVAKENREDECANCGVEADGRELDVHHIIPVSAGGTNHPDNLITLCISCHRKAEEYTKQFTEPHLLKPAL
jgi:5-methylcytosine-specific restriction endonuclease McrA